MLQLIDLDDFLIWFSKNYQEIEEDEYMELETDRKVNREYIILTYTIFGQDTGGIG